MKEARMVINPLYIFPFTRPFVESITFLTRLEKGKNIVIYYPTLGSLLDCLLSIQCKVCIYFFLPSFLIFVVSYEVFILILWQPYHVIFHHNHPHWIYSINVQVSHVIVTPPRT